MWCVSFGLSASLTWLAADLRSGLQGLKTPQVFDLPM